MSILTQHKEMARLCVGCGACLGLCTVGAIKLKATRSVLAVDFDYSRCTKCRMCIKECPVLRNFSEENLGIPDALGRIKKVFSGYSANHEVRYHGASGGIATTLALYMLRHGIVDKVSAVRMKSLEVETLLTSSEHDIISAQGSIYFKTFALRLLQKLLYDLKKGEKLCIIGLPCHISVLRRVLGGFESNLFYIGLICNHINESWYMKHTAEKYLPKNARPISFGHRKDGRPGGIKILFELNKNLGEYTVSFSDFWGPLCELNISSPLGCTLCLDHLACMADIVVGDAWHPKFKKNSSGVSTIIVRTTRGLSLIEEVVRDGLLDVKETRLRDLLLAQEHHLIEGSRYAHFRRELLQHSSKSLRELMELDKLMLAFIIITNRLASRFEVIRRFLGTLLAEELLKIVSLYMYKIKLARACNLHASFLRSIKNRVVLLAPEINGVK